MFFHERLTYFYTNPNHFGFLLVCLILTFYACSRAAGRWKWVCIFWGTALVFPLILSASRGAMLALGVGLAVLGFVNFRQLGCRQLLAILFVLSLLFGVALKSHQDVQRLIVTDVQDGSIQSRVKVWKQWPAMLAAAPAGWGLGRAADSYQQWFERDDPEGVLKHLLSSHGTWLAELPWWGRFVYVWCWCVSLMLCVLVGKPGWLYGALAVWLAFGTAALFNAVGEHFSLWLLPMAWLVAAIFRGQQRARAVGIGTLLSIISFSVLYVVCSYYYPRAAPEIYYRHGHVCIGQHKPDVLLVAPEKEILGDFYGHRLRQLYLENSGTYSFAVAATLEQVNSKFVDGAPLVVCHSFKAVNRLKSFFPESCFIVLNPQDRPAPVLAKRDLVFTGEWTGWQAGPASLPQLKTVPGRKWFLPDWPDIIREQLDLKYPPAIE